MRWLRWLVSWLHFSWSLSRCWRRFSWSSCGRRCGTRWRWGLLLPICVVLLSSGCGTRVILVSPGDPVQLREPVAARVWAFDATGVRVPGEVLLPVGWYVAPVNVPGPVVPPRVP